MSIQARQPRVVDMVSLSIVYDLPLAQIVVRLVSSKLSIFSHAKRIAVVSIYSDL
jgi:hypothetical protein